MFHDNDDPQFTTRHSTESTESSSLRSATFQSTSTPFRQTLAVGERTQLFSSGADVSCDTGYWTSTESHLFTPPSLHPAGRISYRGKRRVDILSLLMLFDPNDGIVENILNYLSYRDRTNLLKVCKNWNNLRNRLPSCFQPPTFHSVSSFSEKENYVLPRQTAVARDRAPLSTLSHCGCRPVSTNSTAAADVQDQLVKEFLHACPVCSGPAFYRPSQWPNRLHCRSSTCGLSVCFTCHREHSPSDRCQASTSGAVVPSTMAQATDRLDTLSLAPRSTSPRSERFGSGRRSRARLNRLALRRL